MYAMVALRILFAALKFSIYTPITIMLRQLQPIFSNSLNSYLYV